MEDIKVKYDEILSVSDGDTEQRRTKKSGADAQSATDSMILFDSDSRENFGNTIHPNRIVVRRLYDFKSDTKRNYENFVESDALMLEVNNTHSDEQMRWITIESIQAIFPGVRFYHHYNRNNIVVKYQEEKSFPERQKFHVVFPLKMTIKDATTYVELHKKACVCFSYTDENGTLQSNFDINARYVARLFMETKESDYGYVDGEKCIDEFFDENKEKVDALLSEFDCLKQNATMKQEYKTNDSTHTNGVETGTPMQTEERNSTLLADALKLLKRYGDTDVAYTRYSDRAFDCAEPLKREEIDNIYNDAKQKFYTTIKANPDYMPLERFNVNGFKYHPTVFADVGQGEVLAREYSNKLIYTDATGFLVYDGVKWSGSEGRDNPAALRIAIELVKKQLQEANIAYKIARDALNEVAETTRDDELTEEQLTHRNALRDAKKYLKFANQYSDVNKLNATLTIAKTLVYHDTDELDDREYLLNTPDGTIDLRDSTKRENAPHDFITQVTGVSMATKEDLDTEVGKRALQQWLDALDVFFCGDEKLIDYVQQVVGMACFGKVYTESLFIATGDGSNGKSTFWNTIEKVLGTYSGKLSPEILTDTGRNNKPELASLKGKRLVIISETEEGMQLSGKMLKTLASTDRIRGEAKYKAPMDFEPQHTAVLYTNYLPILNGRDNGTLRRIGILPFNARIRDNGEKGATRDIKNFSEKLFKECGDVILHWMVIGARKAYKNNFILDKPHVVVEANKAYQLEYDWLQQFLSECTVISDKFVENRKEDPTYTVRTDCGFFVKARELYNTYRSWAKENGEHVRSNTDFKQEMMRDGFTYERKKTGIFIYGLKIIEDKRQNDVM